MPTLNTAARNTMAGYCGNLCSGTLRLLSGATTVADHAVGPYTAGASGVVVDSTVADATIAATGTVNSAKIINGSNEVTLTVGIEGSGAEVIVARRGASPAASDLDYVLGGTSSISSVTLTYPA